MYISSGGGKKRSKHRMAKEGAGSNGMPLLVYMNKLLIHRKRGKIFRELSAAIWLRFAALVSRMPNNHAQIATHAYIYSGITTKSERKSEKRQVVESSPGMCSNNSLRWYSQKRKMLRLTHNAQ